MTGSQGACARCEPRFSTVGWCSGAQAWRSELIVDQNVVRFASIAVWKVSTALASVLRAAASVVRAVARADSQAALSLTGLAHAAATSVF
jgi:hypothetical protein